MIILLIRLSGVIDLGGNTEIHGNYVLSVWSSDGENSAIAQLQHNDKSYFDAKFYTFDHSEWQHDYKDNLQQYVE